MQPPVAIVWLAKPQLRLAILDLLRPPLRPVHPVIGWTTDTDPAGW